MPVPATPLVSAPARLTEIELSPRLLAFLALAQDVSALISLSVEAGLSTAHDWFQTAINVASLRILAGPSKHKAIGPSKPAAGRAVVIIGAAELPGQSLTLQLARAGYTVFPFIPQPSSSFPPASTALSSLLLAWSTLQKRLQARNPSHAGAVVPVILERQNLQDHAVHNARSPVDRFEHANETIRAYCRDNNLQLSAILCIASSLHVQINEPPAMPMTGGIHFRFGDQAASLPSATMQPDQISTGWGVMKPPISQAQTSFGIDEDSLFGLYRANILDPLTAISGLSDLLRGEGSESARRIVFINLSDHLSVQSTTSSASNAQTVVTAAQNAFVRALRGELSPVGVDVCQVMVGPMTPDFGRTSIHSPALSPSIELSPSANGNKLLKAALKSQMALRPMRPTEGEQTEMSKRLELLSRIWAVDDALLYSAVRRAMEDRYPRVRLHAGVSPLVQTLLDMIPGGGTVKMLGRWVVRRLLTACSSAD